MNMCSLCNKPVNQEGNLWFTLDGNRVYVHKSCCKKLAKAYIRRKNT